MSSCLSSCWWLHGTSVVVGMWQGWLNLRIRISIQAQQVHLDVRRTSISEFAVVAQCQSGAICILVRVEKDVGSIIFIVAGFMVLALDEIKGFIEAGRVHTRAHIYMVQVRGCSASHTCLYRKAFSVQWQS